MSELKQLADQIRTINIANGWKVWERDDFLDFPYKFGTVIALIHSEASEALEWYRDGNISAELKLERIKEEMADILIRVLDWWSAYDDDPLEVVRDKLIKNRKRGQRHGGKTI